MAHKSCAGVDAVLNSGDDPPFCPHGPTVLFKRYYSKKGPREFYACAVHRDRKGCPFFHWADEKITPEKQKRWREAYLAKQLTLPMGGRSVDHMKSLPVSQRHYCCHCELLLSHEDLTSHDGHDMISSITDIQLEMPTLMLMPVDDKKSQAQYFFSDESAHFLHDSLKALCYERVLCIGTPRLHELLTKENELESFLLDIDHRFSSFFSPHQYQRYNMFNNYFYSSKGLETCHNFISLSPNKTAIVIDPPFGGLVELLGVSLRKLWEMASTELHTFLIFPYFLESHVVKALPSLWMMDYQVTYNNHKHFIASCKKSKSSPVRIFTNLSLPGIPLPAKNGYRLCVTCYRYVARLNSHCEKCGTCTSKDGQTYVHCDCCKRCVKKSWVHCNVCGKCELPQHECGSKMKVGCHKCGSLEHKRSYCSGLEESRQVTMPPRKKQRVQVSDT